ncbi:uncharacterized protein LOC144142076 [Haemaphysalis longicornis]
MFRKGTTKHNQTVTGSFEEYDASNHSRAMSLISTDGWITYYESLLYQDAQNTCGVIFLTIKKSGRKKIKVCELRVRSKKRPPVATKDCNYAFEVKCRRPHKQVYEDTCPEQ